MSDVRFEQAAQALVAARSAHIGLERLPGELAPGDLAAAYKVQDRFRALWGDRIVGWKTGATAAAVQQRFGIDAPFTGPVFGADLHASPARVPAAGFVHCAVECEFAFRLGHDLPASGGGRSRAEVLAAVDALVPAIEIVSPRFASLMFDAVYSAVADCALNAGLVLGTPVTRFDPDALPAHAVRLVVDGATVAEGTGAKVLGDPVAALVWTVNHLAARGISLSAGEVLSTGTTTGIVYVAAGATAVADFGTLGTVELTFTGPAHLKAVTRLI